MSQLKSKLTPMGIERVMQSADGRTLKVAAMKFTRGWFGVELIGDGGEELGTLQFEQAPALMPGDSLHISGLDVEVSIKVAFIG